MSPRTRPTSMSSRSQAALTAALLSRRSRQRCLSHAMVLYLQSYTSAAACSGVVRGNSAISGGRGGGTIARLWVDAGGDDERRHAEE